MAVKPSSETFNMKGQDLYETISKYINAACLMDFLAA